MRIFIYVNDEKSELEDPNFVAFMLENQSIKINNKKYTVRQIQRELIPVEKHMDSVLHVYLEE